MTTAPPARGRSWWIVRCALCAVLWGPNATAKERAPSGLVVVTADGAWRCPGVQISARTVLTALHCAQAAPIATLKVHTPDAPAAGVGVIRVSAPLRRPGQPDVYDPATDLAVLTLGGSLEGEPRALASNQFRQEEPLTLWLLRPGPGRAHATQVAFVPGRRDGRLVWTTRMTGPGDSGAPVFDATGALIGIATGIAASGGAREASLFLLIEPGDLRRADAPEPITQGDSP